MQQSRRAVSELSVFAGEFLRDVSDLSTGNIRVITNPTPEQRRQTKIAICGYGLGIAALILTGSMAWAFAVTAVGVGGGVLVFGEP